MSFGEKLRTERGINNLSAQQLADACEVSRSYITLIENGKRLPGRKVIPKIAKALNLKMSVLVDWYLEEVVKNKFTEAEF